MDRVAVDVLGLMQKRRKRIVLGGEEVEITSLGFLDWLRFDSWRVDLMSALAEADVPAMVTACREMLEQATGVSATRMEVGEALVALLAVWDLNQIQFVDPALLAPQKQLYKDTVVEWKNRMVLDFVGTLASRFSMAEIEDMDPAFAILMWQQLREEQAIALDAVFYSSEMGYKRQGSGKSARLLPRPSPFDPFWLADRRGRVQRLLMRAAQPEILSPFVTQPTRVIDMSTGKRVGGGNENGAGAG